jgi:hypothetical protein
VWQAFFNTTWEEKAKTATKEMFRHVINGTETVVHKAVDNAEHRFHEIAQAALD